MFFNIGKNLKKIIKVKYPGVRAENWVFWRSARCGENWVSAWITRVFLSTPFFKALFVRGM
jgi:hypothetical protein